MWKWIWKQKLAILGLLISLCFALVAIFAPYLSPHDPYDMDLLVMRKAPDSQHLLGTDELGRDILSRIIWGARLSLVIAMLSISISSVIGTFMGTVSGYFGGILDNLIMRVIDVMMAFPGILLALSLVTFMGPGLRSTIIALGIATIPRFARISRGSVLIAKEQDFVEAARALGSSHTRMIFRHILPNCLAPISVEFSLRFAVIILLSAGLSFLGLGVQPPTPEWGAMMSNGRAYLRVAPHIITFPGMAIMLVVLGFNLLGDGLRDSLDPRLKQ